MKARGGIVSRTRARREDRGTRSFLDSVREGAFARHLSEEAVKITAIWATEYAAKLALNSSLVNLTHVCVETNAVGSCYTNRETIDVPLDRSLVGRNALSPELGDSPWAIAALDAAYASIIRAPETELLLTGSPAKRATARAEVVGDQVCKVANELKGRRRTDICVVNVGVVGDLLALLVQEGFRVTATDYFRPIIGELIHGVRVAEGDAHLDLVRDADIALVTGMTLATGTLEAIIEVARASDTRIVMFAQTGANFAELYINAGVDVVIAEPFPFYLSGCDTFKMKIYRSRPKQEIMAQ